jgi:hypothetical protein
MIGSILARKYWIRVDVTDIEQHSSLIPLPFNYSCKMDTGWYSALMVGSILTQKYWTRVEVTDID